MQRVIVMGSPGSGKSTLARRLGAAHDLPVFHLDQAYFRPGWEPAPATEFRTEVERLAALPRWIIDGNYTDLIGPRFEAADTLVYLDLPAWLTMARVIRRLAASYGRVRPDAARGCPERLDAEFLRYVWTWNRKRRARNLALIERFPGKVVILASRAEQRRFGGA
ncbi:hypothetical protein [Methylobacterium sp. 88A]|uniref:hypothetical protein n=1 Tax=Methylobacterium sp. 88A TaxID=1131813 RepID=UPI000367091D|nr:hypothetical protein [Methylobacterium sp. 88A]